MRSHNVTRRPQHLCRSMQTRPRESGSGPQCSIVRRILEQAAASATNSPAGGTVPVVCSGRASEISRRVSHRTQPSGRSVILLTRPPLKLRSCCFKTELRRKAPFAQSNSRLPQRSTDFHGCLCKENKHCGACQLVFKILRPLERYVLIVCPCFTKPNLNGKLV